MFDNVPLEYSNNSHILKWWNDELDELIVLLIDRHAWYWPWYAAEAIIEAVPEQTLTYWRENDPICERYAWSNILMYFAISRSQRMGFRDNERKPEDRTCARCSKVFNQAECPAWACRRLGGIESLNFCVDCCKRGFFGLGSRVRCSKKSVRFYLSELYRLSGVIPSANFFDTAGPLVGLSVDRQAALLALGECRPKDDCVKRKYGSYLAALIDARVLPDGTRRVGRGTQCLADDGHVCLSLGEKRIDDWFSRHGIEHEREPRYPNSNMRADFKVGHLFIEYFGLAGDAAYDARTVRKRRHARAEGIELVEIYPSDIANEADCDALLSSLVEASVSRRIVGGGAGGPAR